MPRQKSNAGSAPVALPDVTSISSVESSALPEPTNRTALTDGEIAVAQAVINAGSNGNYAVGPKLADKPAAAAAAQRIRRLLGAYWRSLGTAPTDKPSISTRIIPKDGGTTWAITLGAPKSEPSPAGDNANGDAAAAAAVTSAT